MKKIGIGFLGAGSILGHHVAGLRRAAEFCSVVAVAKANPAQADDVRRLLGDVRITGDCADVLADPRVDAVINLLPHDLHLESMLAAARAGKPTLLEKVMARNIDECDQINAACELAKLPLIICHDRRYQPDWMAFKAAVDSGLLGEIYHWKLEHNQNVDTPAGSWIRSRDHLGGGAVMSCLTHQIDALRWMGGEVESVAAMCKTVPARMEGEAIGAILAQMQSGALAQLTINWMTRSDWPREGNKLWCELIHVTGSAGEAFYLTGKGSFLMLYERPERAGTLIEDAAPAANVFMKLRPAGDWTGHQRCIGEWLKLLRGEPAELTTTGRDSRATVEVAEAAYRAAETKCTVRLPIDPRPWT